jgi:hypothetical protein
MNRTRQSLLIMLGLVLAAPAIAPAVPLTMRVTTTGVDGPTCGTATPCRTIARAIANAATGDTIQVGPGLYGDLDGDGIADPGEEPQFIFVNKAVKILSDLGASSTLIRGTSFWITTTGVTLGQLGNGFWVTTPSIPVIVDGSIDGNPARLDVRIGGNVIELDSDVFAGIFAANTRGRIEHNRVVGRRTCWNGYYFTNSWDLITKNVAMGCHVGIHHDAGSPTARLVRNTAIGNTGAGYEVVMAAEFTGNVAVENGIGAIVSSDQIPLFRDNTFAANDTNCGVRNDSPLPINAANNYWGAATGPGTDPADQLCESQPSDGYFSIVTPFLTKDPTQAQSALR